MLIDTVLASLLRGVNGGSSQDLVESIFSAKCWKTSKTCNGDLEESERGAEVTREGVVETDTALQTSFVV